MNSSQDFLDAVDRDMLAANPTIANDPGLAAMVSRANRANLIHFAAANLRNPGAPVPANLGGEPLRLARELVRRGLARSVLEIHRIGQNVAWQRWHDVAFGLTCDPQELRELLDVQFRLANDFVDATLAGIAAQLQSEYDELARDGRAECRRVVDQILEGEPVNPARCQARLGYSLDQSHTAAIIWTDRLNGDYNQLDDAMGAVGRLAGWPRPLCVDVDAETRWVWVNDAVALDSDQIATVLINASQARIAIGTTAKGIDGFRRSHTEALTVQRMMVRLRSPQRVARFEDVEMIALLTEDSAGADDFIKNTLGDLASASPSLRHTVLTYIEEQCNATRTAKRLYTHRNTLQHRLDTADRLLPRPLDQASVEVAVALRTLRWRGGQIVDSTRPRTHAHHNGTVQQCTG